MPEELEELREQIQKLRRRVAQLEQLKVDVEKLKRRGTGKYVSDKRYKGPEFA